MEPLGNAVRALSIPAWLTTPAGDIMERALVEELARRLSGKAVIGADLAAAGGIYGLGTLMWPCILIQGGGRYRI